MMERDNTSHHLDEHAMARYVDGALDADERARIDTHLGECGECRAELIAIRRLVGSQPARRWSFIMPMAAAAAVVLALWVGVERRSPALGPMVTPDGAGETTAVTRDHAPEPTLAPRPLLPVGAVARIDSIAWTSVSDARRYRITVYSSAGKPLWQSVTKDTLVALPDSLRGTSTPVAFWQVKAESQYGRWTESELVAVKVGPNAPQP